MSEPTAKPPKLLDRVRMACRVRHYSIRTEDAYHDWVERFMRLPVVMSRDEVRRVLAELKGAYRLARCGVTTCTSRA